MSDTAKEIWDSFKGHLADRLANPFTGAFLVFWAVCNIRLITVVFWAEPYAKKFTYIDDVLYKTGLDWLLRGLVGPALLAWAYMEFYPRVTSKLAARYRRQLSEANNAMREAEGQQLLSRDEHRAALAGLAARDAQFKADRIAMDDERTGQAELIQVQKKQIAELQATAASLAQERDQLLAATNELVPTRHRLVIDGGGPADDDGESIYMLTNVSPRMGNIPKAYSRMQVRVLDYLRNKEIFFVPDVARSLGTERFDLDPDLQILRQASLVNLEGDRLTITEKGGDVLRSLIQSGVWRPQR